MTDRSVIHGSFDLKRTYPAPRRQVFSAFADPAKKRVWAHGAAEEVFSMSFKPGGVEKFEMQGPGGGTFKYHGTYFDIVDNERIVYAYSFDMGRGVCGVTLTTVEFADAPDGGTHLKFTEQGAYLDGFDGPKFWEMAPLPSSIAWAIFSIPDTSHRRHHDTPQRHTFYLRSQTHL